MLVSAVAKHGNSLLFFILVMCGILEGFSYVQICPSKGGQKEIFIHLLLREE